MTPLDTPTLLRPKTETGRAPTGDESGSRAAPGFEAMLEAFEARPAPAEAGAEDEGIEVAAPRVPADPPSGETEADESGATLRDLMALAAPVPAPAPPTLPPEAALTAIVQRAVARAGVPAAAEPPAPAPRIILVGIETHFAPVQPHGSSAPLLAPLPAPLLGTVPEIDAVWRAGTAVPVAQQAPVATEPALRPETRSATEAVAGPTPRAAPSQAATPRPVGPAEMPARGAWSMPTSPPASTAGTSSVIDAATLGAEPPAAPEPTHRATAQLPPRIAATEPRPVAVPSSSEAAPPPAAVPSGAGAEGSVPSPDARSAPFTVPSQAATVQTGAPRAPARAAASSTPEAVDADGSVGPSAAPAVHAAPASSPLLPPTRATASPVMAASSGTTTDGSIPPQPATAGAQPADPANDPAVLARTAFPAAAATEVAQPPAAQAPPSPDAPQRRASTEGTVTALPPAAEATAPPRPVTTEVAAPPYEAAQSARSDAPPPAAAAPAVAANLPPASPRVRDERRGPAATVTTAQGASAGAAPQPAPRTDLAASPPASGAAAHRAAGERQAAVHASLPGGADRTSGDDLDGEAPADASRSARALSADVRSTGTGVDPAANAAPSSRTLTNDAPGGEGSDRSRGLNDAPPPPANANAGTPPALAPPRPETGVAPQRAEHDGSLLPAVERAVVPERSPDESLAATEIATPAEPPPTEAPVITAPAPTTQAAHPVPASPLRQIFDAVSAQLPAAPPSAPVRTAVPAEAGPLRILTLQLHPADLGTVLVRMRLQDGRLEMNLRTGREETAERLRREGGALSDLLREAGYAPQSLTIEAGGGGAAGSGTERGNSQNFSADPQNGHSGGAPDQSQGRRPSREGQEPAARAKEQDHDSAFPARDRGDLLDRGDLYL